MFHQPKVSHTNKDDTSRAIGADYNLEARIDLGESPCVKLGVNFVWSIEPDFGFTFAVSLILLRIQYWFLLIRRAHTFLAISSSSCIKNLPSPRRRTLSTSCSSYR